MDQRQELFIKVGCGDINLKMPQAMNAAKAFNSMILPPRVTQMEEIKDLIPLLYMNGISTRKVKKAVELFKRNWGRKYPSATECLLTDIESCLTYYKYPSSITGG